MYVFDEKDFQPDVTKRRIVKSVTVEKMVTIKDFEQRIEQLHEQIDQLNGFLVKEQLELAQIREELKIE